MYLRVCLFYIETSFYPQVSGRADDLGCSHAKDPTLTDLEMLKNI